MTNGIDLAALKLNEVADAQKAILESQAEYAIFIIDLEGTVLTALQGISFVYGYNASEIIGKNSTIFFTPHDIKTGKVHKILNTADQKGVWRDKTEQICKNGCIFNAIMSVILQKDAQDIPISFTVIVHDQTKLYGITSDLVKKLDRTKKLLQIKDNELEKTAQLARESNRIKSEFLANVSHELRTPLNGIIGFTQLLYNDMVDLTSIQYKEFLGNITSSANQLLTLINGILEVSKIEAGKMEFFPEQIDTTALLEETKDIFLGSIIKNNIQFIIEIDPKVRTIYMDSARFKEIVYNYVSNAIKFTPKNGTITVRLMSYKHDSYRLEVEDTGIGIKKEDISKIFIKFHQLDAGISKSFPGTGLGLAITKTIVTALGGEIGVKSTVNKGSLFYAILPSLPLPLMPKDEGQASANEIKKTISRILVIEHQLHDQNLMIDTLNQAGYQVITSKNITKAIKTHKKYPFDTIIVDLLFPNKKSWGVIRAFRSKKSVDQAPSIIVTAVLDQPVGVGFKIHDFLIKPVKSKQLLAALEWVGIHPYSDKSILLIDDDEEALAMVNNVLTKHGFSIINRTNKESALLALEQEQPDVILIDPFTSGIDGFEFLRCYHQTDKGECIPVIVWTMAHLNRKERMHLKESMQRILIKEEAIKKSILAGFAQYLPPLK